MVTKEQAVAAGYLQEFYHVRLKNRDGSPVRCRVNGKCKTWKTRPDDWRLPVKYGLRDCFYLSPDNAADWSATIPDGTPGPKSLASLFRI